VGGRRARGHARPVRGPQPCNSDLSADTLLEDRARIGLIGGMAYPTRRSALTRGRMRADTAARQRMPSGWNKLLITGHPASPEHCTQDLHVACEHGQLCSTAEQLECPRLSVRLGPGVTGTWCKRLRAVRPRRVAVHGVKLRSPALVQLVPEQIKQTMRRPSRFCVPFHSVPRKEFQCE
jgi:hypothetical protein